MIDEFRAITLKLIPTIFVILFFIKQLANEHGMRWEGYMKVCAWKWNNQRWGEMRKLFNFSVRYGLDGIPLGSDN